MATLCISTMLCHAEDEEDVIAYAPESAMPGVLELGPSNFTLHVGKEKCAFVWFYAPWCQMCKSLATDFGRLGEVSRVANKSLIIAKVRGDEDSPLAAKYKVDGFPTFLFFAPDSTKSESYDGPRDVNSIIKYINSKLDVHLAPPKSRENNIAAPVDGFIELDGRSIVENIARPWGFFLIFYLPWCVHCNKLAAELPKIAKIVEQSGHQDKIVLGKVNIGLHAALAATYFITNYPAIQFYEPRSDGPVMYSGPREALPIVKWMEHVSKLNLRNKVEESWVVQLDARNYDSIAMDPNRSVLVDFYTSWCDHCKTFAATLEEVAQTYAGDRDKLVLAAFDIELNGHNAIRTREQIEVYPTIKWFPATHDKQKVKTGEVVFWDEEIRSKEHLIKFFNEKLGLKRIVGGGLAEDAGTDAELDKLASEFMAANKDARSGVKARMVTRAAAVAETGSVYLKIAESIEKKGEKYVTQEIGRVNKMLEGRRVSLEKRDELSIRRNILRNFKKA